MGCPRDEPFENEFKADLLEPNEAQVRSPPKLKQARFRPNSEIKGPLTSEP
jgi:hypothetical protein